jgi:hypothetical protein
MTCNIPSITFNIHPPSYPTDRLVLCLVVALYFYLRQIRGKTVNVAFCTFSYGLDGCSGPQTVYSHTRVAIGRMLWTMEIW